MLDIIFMKYFFSEQYRLGGFQSTPLVANKILSVPVYFNVLKNCFESRREAFIKFKSS